MSMVFNQRVAHYASRGVSLLIRASNLFFLKLLGIKD